MEHVHSEHVAATPDEVFSVLRDPASLARFVPQLTRVDPEGGRVRVQARYDGHTQEGEASFDIDEAARRVDWGADSGYRGWLQVEADGDGSIVTLGLHTNHVEHADHEVGSTLAAIRSLLEAEV